MCQIETKKTTCSYSVSTIYCAITQLSKYYYFNKCTPYRICRYAAANQKQDEFNVKYDLPSTPTIYVKLHKQTIAGTIDVSKQHYSIRLKINGSVCSDQLTRVV